VILVTGGTGFVGGHVVGALRERELPVRILARDAGSERARELEQLGCEIVGGDVADNATVRAALRGVDVVVHLVAIRQGKPEDFERVMTQATRDLVAGSREAGVRRFVLMSALGASEETKDLVPYYGAKWAMEETVRASGLEHVIFRPSFVFAPDGGILKTFAKLVKAPVTPIIGSGLQRIQPIWGDDVGAYFAAGVDKPEAANRTFEIGGPEAVTWNEFWDRLKRARGVRRPSVHMPVGFMRLNALVTERLPGDIPLTRDLLKMLEGPDSVVSNDDAVETFQLPLLPLDEQLRRGTQKAAA
jgi:NADH dehydrogenase